MRDTIRRAVTVAPATGGALALFPEVAAAPRNRTNESVAGKAGEAYALLGEDDDILALSGLTMTGDEIVGGGCADLILDDGDGVLDPGDWVLADNVFLHAGLPVSALEAPRRDIEPSLAGSPRRLAGQVSRI